MIIRLTRDIFVESTNILYTEQTCAGDLDIWLRQDTQGASLVQVAKEDVPAALRALAAACAAQLRAVQLIGDEANREPESCA